MRKPFRPSKSLSTMILGVAFLAALIAVAVAAQTSSESAGVLVHTRLGTIAGLTVGKVEQFRGVPYAAPPLGELRWRAPLAPKPYSGTQQATKFPAPCVQGRAAADLPAPCPARVRSAAGGSVDPCRYGTVRPGRRGTSGSRSPEAPPARFGHRPKPGP